MTSPDDRAQSPAAAPEGARCWATIDLRALADNCRQIQRHIGDARRYVAVVKADAYGMGIRPVAATLTRSGVHLFAVANVAEALEVREQAADADVLVLSPLLPGEEQTVVEHGLIPLLSSAGELQRCQSAARRVGKQITYHLKIDTGMSRLGVHYSDLEHIRTLTCDSEHTRLSGICTHFAAADNTPEFTRLQRNRFRSVLDDLGLVSSKDLLIHADNSAGLDSLTIDDPCNAVRVGLLQFGTAPNPSGATSALSIHPVLSLHTRVGLVRTLPADSDVSYARTYRTRRSTRIAVLTAGYCDGIPVALSNRGEVLISGKRCPIIGRVTMDQVIVDVTDLSQPPIEGDIATLIGPQGNSRILLEEFSNWANTIPWEICCSISKRVLRHFIT